MMRNSCVNVPAEGKKLLNRGIVKCRGQNEKIGVDWPRPDVFRKNCQSVRCWNQKIGVDWPRQEAFQKKIFNVQVGLTVAGIVDQNLALTSWVFCQKFRTWGLPKGLALRWSAFDKRCSSFYTLRRCVFADIQTREEYRCSCKLEGNKVKKCSAV